MKTRIITAAFIFLLLTALSLLGAYNLNCILSGQRQLCSANIVAAFSGLADQKARLLFFLFVSLSALLIGYMLFAGSYIKYKSDTVQITPDIRTPVAEGQGQYGTARWMPPEKLETAFSVIVVDAGSPLLHGLAAEGRADLKEDDL